MARSAGLESWWGDDPPFHHPVFVLTHHPREPLQLKGGNTFTFVTEGIKSALEQAHRAANDKDVLLPGGAKSGSAVPRAGLVDEALINLAPVLLGDGERLFENLGKRPPELELAESIPSSGVTHLMFRARRARPARKS